MRKSLLLALLLLQFLPFGAHAQNNLFDLETDTVCVGQSVRITPRAMNATSYYWGFCSGYLETQPLLDNLGPNFNFSGVASIEVGRDDDNNYYGFAVNGTTTELLRLNFGKSLHNTPTVTNFGNLDLAVPTSPNSVYLTRDSGKWFLFVCGGSGTTNANSSVARFDFGPRLSNTPNGVNMGNPGGLLIDPRGIFVARDGNTYYGFVVNAGNNRLIRLNFGNNISRTPTATNITISGAFMGGYLNGPRDIAPVYDQGSWYFIIPNLTGNSIVRLYFGNTLSNNPAGSYVAFNNFGPNGTLDQPSAISLIKDCGSYHVFVTNRGASELLRYDISSIAAASYSPVSATFNPIGAFDAPADITRIIRDKDSLFAFVINATDNSLVRAVFPQCNNTDISSSTAAQPPAFKYDTAGLYNIYLAVNEGLPNMDMACKQIRVLNVPPITVTPDTLICQGDTLSVIALSQGSLGSIISPNYNLSDTFARFFYVYPELTTVYNIHIPYINGCVVDTNLRVDVSRVIADAGPDRTLFDGAHTVLGGPGTLVGSQYIYEWSPAQYIDNPYVLHPTANPPRDLTYTLKITNGDRCVAIDTVNVKVICNDFNVPNAFSPDNGRGAPKRFGILNKQQAFTLNYFRIFDRWGKEVFSTTDQTKEWDGTVGGDPAPFGVYVWEADGFCATKEHIHKNGNVTLLR